MKAFKIFGVWVLAALGAVACARFFRNKILKKRFIGILAYHHITKNGLGPVSPVATLPGVFSRHVKVFSRVFRVLLMKDVCALLKSGAEFDKDGLVFTFDDGYRDSFEEAAPLLEAAGIRGVFYITGVSFTPRALLWNDIVGEALVSLSLRDFGELELGPSGFKDLLRKTALAHGKKKEFFIGQAFDLLFEEGPVSRQKICDQLHRILIKNKTGINPSRILMDPEEIKTLALRGHEIGAHTLTHARLSKSGGTAKNEIVESVYVLRKNGLTVSSFAFPFGMDGDMDLSCRDTLRHAGISNAVTMKKNVVSSASDLYFLPRIPVSPHHGASFITAQFECMAWAQLARSLFHVFRPIKTAENLLVNVN